MLLILLLIDRLNSFVPNTVPNVGHRGTEPAVCSKNHQQTTTAIHATCCECSTRFVTWKLALYTTYILVGLFLCCCHFSSSSYMYPTPFKKARSDNPSMVEIAIEDSPNPKAWLPYPFAYPFWWIILAMQKSDTKASVCLGKSHPTGPMAAKNPPEFSTMCWTDRLDRLYIPMGPSFL